MNEKIKAFKAEPVVLNFGEKQYKLVYDLNAFCELEKIYNSVDDVLKMLLGTKAPEMDKVTYNGAPVNVNDIMVDDIPLATFIAKASNVPVAKHEDTRNLLWAGCLHDHTEYDEFGEIKRYNIGKAELGKHVTFSNLREVNGKIMTAILRDLIPDGEDAEEKNEEPLEQSSGQLKLTMK